MDGRTWRYVTTPPGNDWMRQAFDDSGWPNGQAPFGGGKPEGVPIRTAWTTPLIWMRQSFTWAGGRNEGLYVVLTHDEDVTVYLNGVEAASVPGYSTGYVMVPVNEQGARALISGSNVIAVRCQQTKGGQAIDVGIVRVDPAR
jgi:hypothetical protein